MIERDGKIFVLGCDVCGETAPELFDSFHDAVDYKQPSGWRSQKCCDEWERIYWEDICPECQNAE